MAILRMELWTTLAMVGVTLAISTVWAVLVKQVWEPLRMKRIMARQGITGPPNWFLLGNMLELLEHQNSQPVLPLDEDHYSLCPGILPHHTLIDLCTQDPEVVRDVLSNKSSFFSKTAIEVNLLKELLGHRLSIMEGEQWATNRRTLNPMFHIEVLKDMIGAVVKGAAPLVQKWEHLVAKAGGSMEIEVESEIIKIAGNILTHTAFGTDDADKGRQVSELQKECVDDMFTPVCSPESAFKTCRIIHNLDFKASKHAYY